MSDDLLAARPPSDRPAGTNWSGNLTYRAARLHRPRTVAELQEVVARSERVKALGSRHCFNDIADTTADLVALDRLPAEVTFEAADDGGTVWLAGGMPYSTLVQLLNERGY